MCGEGEDVGGLVHASMVEVEAAEEGISGEEHGEGSLVGDELLGEHADNEGLDGWDVEDGRVLGGEGFVELDFDIVWQRTPRTLPSPLGGRGTDS